MSSPRSPIAFIAAAVGLALVAVAGASFAASDGQLDGTSTGTVDIDLEIPELVQISNLDDIDLGAFDGGAVSGTDDVCVWSTTRSYSLTATGGDGGFVLTGAATATSLPYAVQWASAGGATSGATLTAGASLPGLDTSATSPTCQGGAALNASVIVSVSDGDMAAAVADTYTGTLTLLVEPN